MKTMQNLKGAKALNSNQQKSIIGGQFDGIHPTGSIPCESDADCSPGFCVIWVGQTSGFCNSMKKVTCKLGKGKLAETDRQTRTKQDFVCSIIRGY